MLCFIPSWEKFFKVLFHLFDNSFSVFFTLSLIQPGVNKEEIVVREIPSVLDIDNHVFQLENCEY